MMADNKEQKVCVKFCFLIGKSARIWPIMEDGSKSECCMTGNLPQGLPLVLNQYGAISESECNLTEEFINTVNLRTLEVETFNMLKVDRHIKEYG